MAGATDLSSQLEAFLARYATAIRGLGYDGLKTLQRGPHAPLSAGGAATAYAICRLADTGRLPKGGRMAESWIRAALADRSRAAYVGPEGQRHPSGSLMAGRAGLHATAALIAFARHDDREGHRRLLAYKRTCLRSLPHPDLVHGTPGQLLGACTLLGLADNATVRNLGDELADKLAGDVRRRIRRPWSPDDACGLAHSWSGALYALATWRRLRGRDLEPWVIDAATRLARVWTANAATTAMRGTWCNGAAGTLLFLIRMYECSRRYAFLRSARTAARAAMRYLPERNHLCCGSGGVAYALLALDRSDGRNGWRARATEIGVRAVSLPLQSRWPNGLLWGHPGLVCLALDLLADEPRGFPWIDSGRATL